MRKLGAQGLSGPGLDTRSVCMFELRRSGDAELAHTSDERFP